MPDFAQAKIYKLVNSIDNLIYVGSTCDTLLSRKSKHKDKSKTRQDTKVYKHLNLVGWENVSIELIEAYECESKEKLLTRERYWVKTLKPDLNTLNPITSSEEREEYKKVFMKEYNKDYYQKNKEELTAYWKEYRELNKEELLSRKKEYYEKNKEEISAYFKEYREKNKDKINEKRREKITCECGGRYTLQNKSQHMRSKKHLNYINQK